MATVQRNVKTYGNRNFVAEVASAPSNYAPILSNEVDADLDTIYAAWNGGIDTVNVKDGSITYAKLAPNAQLWQDTGTVLTPGVNYTSRPLTVPATLSTFGTAAQVLHTLNFGPRCVLQSDVNQFNLFTNSPGSLNYDNASPGWNMQVIQTGGADRFLLQRRPGASTTYAAMLQVDNAGNLTAPGPTQVIGPAGGACTILIGRRGQLYGDVSTADLYSNGPSSQNYDRNTSHSWLIRAAATADLVQFLRRTANTDTFTQMLVVDASGNLTITGGVATKAAGTAWVNPSDRRLKDEIADYPTGLAAIQQLQPRTFLYNGKGGSTAGMRGYGFIADEIAPVMPETVGVCAGKLDDDADETEIQTLDQSNLILALVNATKELAARVAALEAA